MKKKIIIGAIAFIILFVVADYLEILPCVPDMCVDGGIWVPCKFQFLDLKQKPVGNVTITASLDDYDIGEQLEYKYDSNDPSLVVGKIFFMMGWKKTLFFHKPMLHRRSFNRQEVEFYFKHPDYFEQKKLFLMKDLKKKIHTIILQPKEQANEKDN